MGKVTGFLEHRREDTPYRPVEERLRDWHEVQADPPPQQVREQQPRRARADDADLGLHSLSRRAAFCFMMSGRTSGLIGSFSNSATQRTGSITG